MSHKAGGGAVKVDIHRAATAYTDCKNLRSLDFNFTSPLQIYNEKLEFKAKSRIGSLANVKHRAGGGDKKIFDDKEYARQMSDTMSCPARSGPTSLEGSLVGSNLQVETISA